MKKERSVMAVTGVRGIDLFFITFVTPPGAHPGNAPMGTYFRLPND
jgi:hypothetical protein